ncbi:MAG: hypothetical protein NVSMB64_17360 [Candidatus Velthaea sp.]
MNDVRALAYADWRALVNGVRTIRASPGRLVAWLLYVILIAAFIVTRAIAPAQRVTADLARADYLMCLLAAGLLLSFAFGRSGWGLFRSRVEAHFIVGSPIRAPLAASYLLARDSIARMSRTMTSSVYALFIFAPRSIGGWQAASDVVLIAALLIAGSAILVPRQLVTGAKSAVLAIAGAAIAALAALPAIRDAVVGYSLFAPLAPVAARLPAWHPGLVLLTWNAVWVVAAIVAAVAALAWLALVAHDAYPELFALSVARIDDAKRVSARRGSARAAAGSALPVVSAGAAPRGVLAYVWKSAVEYRRRFSVRALAAIAAGGLGAGYAFARLSRVDDGALFGAFFGVVVTSTIVFSSVAARALAAELRRPMFWLSPAWLIERIGALAVGRWWPSASCAVLAAIGFTAGGGSLVQVLALGVGLPALFFLVNAIGFASFALMPKEMDQRGPLALARIALAYALIVPPVGVFGAATLALDAPLPGLLGATLIGAVEAAALLGFAAWRLDGRIDRLAAI